MASKSEASGGTNSVAQTGAWNWLTQETSATLFISIFYLMSQSTAPTTLLAWKVWGLSQAAELSKQLSAPRFPECIGRRLSDQTLTSGINLLREVDLEENLRQQGIRLGGEHASGEPVSHWRWWNRKVICYWTASRTPQGLGILDSNYQ